MNRSTVAVNQHLLQVGLEVYRICGDERGGWSLDEGELSPQPPARFRYGSLEELFFALVNFSLSEEGQA